MAYRFLIVDDERLSRCYLHDLLMEFLPDAIITEADDATKAMQILETAEIDVLFLDIQMPGQNGFAMLRQLKSRPFELVFVTAYSQYAISAIRQGAVDYLLKPVKKSEFKSMLERVLNRIRTEAGPPPENTSEQYLEGSISLSHQQGLRVIRLRDIIYLKADNTYTTFYLTGGEKFTSSKPISRYEDQLSAAWFFRVHKSYIINFAHFKEYLSRDGTLAIMDNGDRLQISRYRLADFLNLIKARAGAAPAG